MTDTRDDRTGAGVKRGEGLLGVDLAGMMLRNPVMLAAGTAGTLDEYADVLPLNALGGIVTKSITVEPRLGNATWRIVPSSHGMLNAIGLANIGVEAFVREVAPRVAGVPTTIIGSVSEFSVEGYVRVAAAMNEIPGLAGVELNVSCPNVNHGCEFGSDAGLLSELVREVRAVLTKVRLLVKLSPTVMATPGIVPICRAAIEPGRANGGGGGSGEGAVAGPNGRPGADGVCIANTVPAMAIDVETREPRLSRGSGGLSGPGIHPIAVKLVHDAYVGICRETQTPIVGIGGVVAWQDAAEFILAGASAVEMGTGLFVDPRSPLKVIEGLGRWVQRQGEGNVSALVGKVKLKG